MSEEESTQINQFGQAAGALIHRWDSIYFWWIEPSFGAWSSCPTPCSWRCFCSLLPSAVLVRVTGGSIVHYALSQLHEDWSRINFLRSFWTKNITFMSKHGSFNPERTHYLWISMIFIRNETKASLAQMRSWVLITLTLSRDFWKKSLCAHLLILLLRHSAPWSEPLRQNSQSHIRKVLIKLPYVQLPFTSLWPC